jgi:Flp pilus assembly protein TadB
LLDAIAADLRGGSSLRSAVAASAGSAGLTGVAFNPTTTLSVVPTLTSPEPAEAVVLQTVTVAAALGGAAATTLESGAALLRERAAIRADVVAHAAQAQLSARVLTAVPLIFAAWSLAASRSFRVAVCSPPGATCVALGLLCNMAGWWWMRRIVASAWR